MNEQLFFLASQKKKTSHVLHLLLCIPTAGLWLIVWLMIGIHNGMHNSSIDRKMQRIMQHKANGETDAETSKAIRQQDEYKSKVLLLICGLVILMMYLGTSH
jgi:anaerobic C4-dicarboxylate transporter